MNGRGTPERVSEALMRAFGHWENRRAARGEISGSGYHAHAFTITISREAGAARQHRGSRRGAAVGLGGL